MLADLEWDTPHTKPFGLTVARYVESVRCFEVNGYLRDPFEDPAFIKKQEPFYGMMKLRTDICIRMCWRERCVRAKRCKSFLPLAIRDFQPEFIIHINTCANLPLPFLNGTPDPEKMEVLNEIFPPHTIERRKT